MIPTVMSMRSRHAVAMKQYISPIGVAAMIICEAAGIALTVFYRNPAPALILLLAGLYLMFSIKVADQWQKAAVLRLGRYIGLRGPGMFMIIPIIDTISQYVDQRVRVTDVKAESALTRDTVPVNVDAIVFWLVWNAEKSILEVQNFTDAITLSAQTGLRESIGRHDLAQMITEREMLGQELQRILDQKTNPWGITVHSVRREYELNYWGLDNRFRMLRIGIFCFFMPPCEHTRTEMLARRDGVDYLRCLECDQVFEADDLEAVPVYDEDDEPAA